MKVLKLKGFTDHSGLVIFVNDNNIANEDILTIVSNDSAIDDVIMFFYADSEITEKERNMWGKLKD